jgi:hypothetical protein
MSSDYNRQIVTSWDGKLPIDEFGHYLDPTTVVPVEPTHPWNYRKHRPYKRVISARRVALDHVCHQDLLGNRRKFFWATELTNPYGCLHWAIGNGDDFFCFDYAILPDGRVVLDATVNSETGSFIQSAGYEVVSKEDAPQVALNMVGEGITWAADNDVRISKKGWNQDPYFFYRCVCLACADDHPEFSDRQKRFGGKKIDAFCNLTVDISNSVW